ncbi:iron complex transport system ATP-binding protein [Pseudarthrobacter sp. W1I19]|uniref:siderophore-interacting protein n=1 Tax=Pseudarthrobacter sp. W1I19 TaxID=3042288 RepID=UPI002781BEC8|nr:siderophore-interacting protein [Pseudarthrobacter sp. W1I19]MDQ0922237.1 iron complex transport system ATP-binding protein [Pseudarthrobacter sp. W1I19]
MNTRPEADRYPVRVFEVAVSRVQDLSATFRRITFTGPALDRFGVEGPTLDLRIKLLLPVPGHTLSRPGAPDGTLYEGWYHDWLRLEQPGRGFIRSYTVRAGRTMAGAREIDVDFALHPHVEGKSSPASDWARAAVPGVSALIIGPEVAAQTALPSEAGIRWSPRNAREVLLAGDETAVPAIGSIIEALPADFTGHAFLEVPDSSDIQEVSTASGVRVTWLPRNPAKARRDELLLDAVRHTVSAPGQTGPDVVPLYAWVGAEAGTAKMLRRHLVNEIGLDPKVSEFRGYWSLGKAGSGVNGTPVPAPELCTS